MTTEEPAKIAVLGSCITRDSFNTRFNPNYKEFYNCVLMQNQMSIISLMSEGFTLTDHEYGDMTAYDRWNVRTDLNKEFLTKVVTEQPRYLILDFFGDVHFGCLRLRDGRFITNNRWKLWQTNYYKRLKLDGAFEEFRLQINTEDYLPVWKTAFDRLADHLHTRLPTTTIIVHRGRNTDRLQLPGRLDLVPLLEHRKKAELDVPLANQLWATLDDYAASKPGYEVIDLTDKEYPTFDDHPWGPFYVHYTMDYYADFLTALHRIHLKHSYCLTDTDLSVRLLADVQRLAQVSGSVQMAQLQTNIDQRDAKLTQQRTEIAKLREETASAPINKVPAKKTPPPRSTKTRVKRRARRAIKRVAVLDRAWQTYARSRPARAAAKAPVTKETTKSTTGASKPKSELKPDGFGPVTATLCTARWLDPTHFEVSGWVFSQGVPATIDSRPQLQLRLLNGNSRIEPRVSLRTDAEVNTVAKDAIDYSGSAFTAVFDLGALLSEDASDESWLLSYALTFGDLITEGRFDSRVNSGSAGALVPSTCAPPCLLPSWSQDGLTIERSSVLPTTQPLERPLFLLSDFNLVDGVVPRIRIAGQLEGRDPTGVTFQLRGPTGTIESEDLQWNDRAFSTTLPLIGTFWGGRPAPLAQGNYDLWTLDSEGEHIRSALTSGCMQQLPIRFRAERLTARLGRTTADAPQVQIKPPLRDDEIGKVNQARLEKHYVETKLIPDGSVYFETFYGRSASDSPRAIHDELIRRGSTKPKYWAVADYSVQLPEGAIPVLIRSREWWDLLARASFFVHNCGTPGPLRKRDDQVVVQTWHGTPLKLLGYDRPSNYSKPSFPRLMAKSSSRWTYMIAGNTYSAEIFKKAYFFHGTMLNLGYPRNDALVDASTADLAEIRRKIGIAPGQRVVLYAPTWRDGEAGVVGYLDPEELGRALGPDHLILVRGHTNTLRNAQRLVGRQMLDVTSYPSINELFLAADVMITDYSSVMFDFSVTGSR